MMMKKMSRLRTKSSIGAEVDAVGRLLRLCDVSV